MCVQFASYEIHKGVILSRLSIAIFSSQSFLRISDFYTSLNSARIDVIVTKITNEKHKRWKSEREKLNTCVHVRSTK